MAPLISIPALQHLDLPSALPSLKTKAFSKEVLRNAKGALLATGLDIAKRSAQNSLSRRSLSVTSTQKVTLGIIAVYVVVIALLWTLPYVRWTLWPFKVSAQRSL